MSSHAVGVGVALGLVGLFSMGLGLSVLRKIPGSRARLARAEEGARAGEDAPLREGAAALLEGVIEPWGTPQPPPLAGAPAVFVEVTATYRRSRGHTGTTTLVRAQHPFVLLCREQRVLCDATGAHWIPPSPTTLDPAGAQAEELRAWLASVGAQQPPSGTLALSVRLVRVGERAALSGTLEARDAPAPEGDAPAPGRMFALAQRARHPLAITVGDTRALLMRLRFEPQGLWSHGAFMLAVGLAVMLLGGAILLVAA